MEKNKNSTHKNATLWLLFSCFMAFYWGLSSYDLLNNNEGLYAQIAWEMLENKDFVIPTLNGVPYIEKPPMLYWLVAGSHTLFGKSVWAARFVPATFGLLTVLSLLLFHTSLGQRKRGLQAATLLSSSLGFAIFSRMVFFDVLLTAFFTFTLLSFYLWEQTNKKRWKRLFYGFLGCAVLTKGLLSLCLAGAICLWFLAWKYRSFKKVLSLWDTLGVILFFTITVPWHWMAHLRQVDFSWFYFVNEHLLRFLDQRLPRDYYRGPFYYYLIRIPAYFIPWPFLIPFMGKKTPEDYPDRSLKGFLWIWFAVSLAFFTLSKAKANYYMVLGMPPLALLITEYGFVRQRFKALLKIAVVLSATLLLAATRILPKRNEEFSAKGPALFLKSKNWHHPVYLYKRFETFSSILFYHGTPLPIVDSESADLDFGSKTPEAQGRFLSFDTVFQDPSAKAFIVHERDKKNFEKRCGPSCHSLYQDSKHHVYLMEGVHP